MIHLTSTFSYQVLSICCVVYLLTSIFDGNHDNKGSALVEFWEKYSPYTCHLCPFLKFRVKLFYCIFYEISLNLLISPYYKIWKIKVRYFLPNFLPLLIV